MGKEREVRDDGEEDSRAGFNIVKVQTHGKPAKVDMSCESGEGGCRKAVETSKSMSKIVAEVDGTKVSQQTAWGKNSYFRPVKKFTLGQQKELGLGRGPAKEDQVFEVFKEVVEMGGPKTVPSKGVVVVGRPNFENSNGIRACDGGLCVCGEQEWEMFSSQMGSLSPTFNLTMITDEALMEEASRYSDHFSHSLFS